MRKKRKTQSKGTLIILATSLIMLNSLGVSYAYWNDNLNMDVSVSTGYIKPYFIWSEIEVEDDLEREIDLENSETNGLAAEDVNIISNELPVGITVEMKGDNTLNITGRCYEDSNTNILIKFGNKGTVPIAYQGMTREDEEGADENISIEEISYTDNEEEIKIQVIAGKESESESEIPSFNYELLFEQGIK